jgi:hypothetical protein
MSGTQVRGRVITCPGCEGDGCCVCDHEGRIYESALGIQDNGLSVVEDAGEIGGSMSGVRKGSNDLKVYAGRAWVERNKA